MKYLGKKLVDRKWWLFFGAVLLVLCCVDVEKAEASFDTSIDYGHLYWQSDNKRLHAEWSPIDTKPGWGCNDQTSVWSCGCACVDEGQDQALHPIVVLYNNGSKWDEFWQPAIVWHTSGEYWDPVQKPYNDFYVDLPSLPAGSFSAQLCFWLENRTDTIEHKNICTGSVCISGNCCGNGVIEYHLGEQCDDGNTSNGDGCDSSCKLELPKCNDKCGERVMFSVLPCPTGLECMYYRPWGWQALARPGAGIPGWRTRCPVGADCRCRLPSSPDDERCGVSADPANGSCGPAINNGQPYAWNAGGWAGALCSTGTAVPASVAFPSAGSSASWVCQGSGGGLSVPCSASRDSAPAAGACGGANNYNFAYNVYAYTPSLNQCNSGTSSNTAFPAQGSTAFWVCQSPTGNSPQCRATRSNAPVNGVCGNAAGRYLASAGAYRSPYCSAGRVVNIRPFPNTGQTIDPAWTCQGLYGGSDVTCSVSRDSMVSSTCPSCGTKDIQISITVPDIACPGCP